MPLPSDVDRNQLWSRLGDAVAKQGVPLPTPVFVVDLDAFDANADDLVRRAGGLPDPGGLQVAAHPGPGRAGAGPRGLPRRARVHPA